ncbi:uncharacterized protein B0H64DRAFT_441652 [Chaetomium fimeti]|uniref:Uncharacterized protein n=1 Tax=Chaetomium fimeti TaxID=1854472 RepID=A0AAE0HEU0_9PEZI|nr:hypothetical protein B0H64DRAFT_441652 [Chaetomium fimeti]
MANSDIDEFLRAASTRRSSVAHIQGSHGSGKSTVVIPHIWRAIQSDESVTMAYIQPTNAQAILLGRFLRSSGDTTMANGLDDKRLNLWSFEDALPKMLDPAQTLHGNMVVCLDLDVGPTAYGEFLLACLVEKAMQVYSAKNGHDRLILFTLGAMEHRYPTKLEPFTNPVVIHYGGHSRAPEPRHIESLEGKPVFRIMMDMKDAGGGVLLVFSGIPDLRSDMMRELTNYYRGTQHSMEVYRLTTTNLRNGSFVEWIDSLKGCAVVMVDPSINISLPFRHVHAVFYALDTRRPVLDSSTGLFLRREVRSSEPEFAVYRSHAVPAPDVPSPQVLAVGPEPQRTLSAVPFPHAYGSELLVLALLAFQKWPIPVDEMPLVHLGVPDHAKWREASGLLQGMGMLVEDNQAASGWRITSPGRRAISWLPHTSNWRVAVLLSYVEKTALDLEKRVLIRLAAIIEADVPFAIKPPMTRALMRGLNAAACGPAATMVDYGHLWVALSVWEAVRRRTDNFADESTHGDLMAPADLGVLQGGYDIYKRVVALEKMMDMPPESAASMDKALTPPELFKVQLALARVWLSNLFWVPKSWKQSGGDTRLATCFANRDAILIDTITESIVMEGLVDNHGLYATALDIIYGDEGLRAWNTVLIDGRCLRRIHQRMGGAPDIYSAFSSVYAHRGRDAK